MSRGCQWLFSLLILTLSSSASGQFDPLSGTRDARVFRPRLFSDRPPFVYPDSYPSMSDRISWYGFGPSLSSTRYYDSVVGSPYGLDASRCLYQGTASRSIWQDR